jgi:hypothetical protein
MKDMQLKGIMNKIKHNKRIISHFLEQAMNKLFITRTNYE